MNVLAICAGIGGLELGIKQAAPFTRTVCYLERETYAAATLVARMEDGSLDPAPVWDDLAAFDGSKWRGVVDCIAGGFPCQPFSQAGKLQRTEDDRWLWDDILRIIDETGCTTCFFENVPGLTALGLRRIALDLAERGFRVEWDMFTAQAVGAGHIRKRIFVLAHRHSDGCQPCPLVRIHQNVADTGHVPRQVQETSEPRHEGRTPAPRPSRTSVVAHTPSNLRGSSGHQGRVSPDGTVPENVGDSKSVRSGKRGPEPERQQRRFDASQSSGQVGDSDESRLQRRGGELEQEGSNQLAPWPPSPEDAESWARIIRERPDFAPALPQIRRGADGLPDELVQSASEYRHDRLRALGNAVVPQVAEIALQFLAGQWLTDRGLDMTDEVQQWI